jgi:membrane-bound lytic murein transglycosylase B
MANRFFISFFMCLVAIFYSYTAQADTYFIKQKPVKVFIKDMVKKHHFNEAQLIKLFSQVKVRPKVIRQVKNPFEKQPWYAYQMLFITEWRIREGVEFWNRYQDVLERAEKQYGVPASIIVATIGVETKYGKHTGDYRVIDALVNIGFSDSPRAPFFRNELKEFLLLTREHHQDPLKVMGSYAGAIGQPQFMPSSYRKYAVNFSGSGKIDLSHNEVDVIGSVANYYREHGWENSQPVAVPASLTGGRYRMNLSRPRVFSSDLAGYGNIPSEDDLQDQKYKVLSLRGYYGNEYWLSFHNFDVIKRYNPSDLYAMAVYQLSYYISSLRERLADA